MARAFCSREREVRLGVDDCVLNVGMAEPILHKTKVSAFVKQVGGDCVKGSDQIAVEIQHGVPLSTEQEPTLTS